MRVILYLALCGFDTANFDLMAQMPLTQAQTLRLSQSSPFSETGAKYHLFKRACSDANSELVRQCETIAQEEKQPDSSAIILGYTGGSKEASSLIKIIEGVAQRYNQAAENDRFVTGKGSRFLNTIVVGLGIMARRNVPEAKRFLNQSVSSAETGLGRLEWYGPPGQSEAMSYDLAFIGYAISQQPNLESKLALAKKQMKQNFPESDWCQTTSDGFKYYVDMIKALENRAVTDREAASYLSH